MFVLTLFLPKFTSEEPVPVTSEVAEGLLRGGFLDIVALAYYLFIVSSLIVVFFADIKYGIIPDKIVFPSIIVSMVYFFMLHNSYFIIHLLSALGAFLFFLLLFLVSRGRGMGFGDVKLVFLLGLFLGWPQIIIALYFSFLTGAIIGCILVLWRKKRFSGGTIPFGPFLAAGAFVSLFWGEYILGKIAEGLLW
jgi:leader peptidase (prepilin peptidase)/N-methyltransferase